MEEELLEVWIRKELNGLESEIQRVQQYTMRRDIQSLDYPEWRGDPHLLPFTEYDHEIGEMFQELRLNPQDPVHWRALMNAFCRAYIQYRKRTTGRPKEWTEKRRAALAADIRQIKLKAVGVQLKYSEIAQRLQVMHPERYGDLSVERLRKLVSSTTEDVVKILALKFPHVFKDNLWDGDW